MIVKIDFEKAFDKVEYSAIILMLKHLGVGEKFISWVISILNSASTSIILNGVPGKKLIAKEEYDKVIHYLPFYLY